MISEIKDILQDNKLRVTPCRKEILKMFVDRDTALSHADIEQQMGTEFDRVTIYRNLRTFLKKGLIHKVLDDITGPKYALCNDKCQPDEHHHFHVHFKCEVCLQTHCLEEVKIPEIKLPQKYLVKETNLLVTGICEICHT